MSLVDSHCHLTLPELASDVDGVLARMRAAGVDTCLTVSVSLADFNQVIAIARRHAGVYASVGVHPDQDPEPAGQTEPTESTEPTVEGLVARAADPAVVAIGETGLDYYRLAEPLEWQRERFRVHIRAARANGKPLIIHTRNAAADTLAIMREEGAAKVGGVMHCFTESHDVAEAALSMNFLISFSGIVTFKNARDLQATAARLPEDSLLIETDAPYLAPVPHRGKTNQPAWVVEVAAKLAALRGVPPEQIGAATTRNFRRLFLERRASPPE
jgi:TatD DNase family protein